MSFFEWFDKVSDRAKESRVGKIAVSAGYGIAHTGGGCLCWEKVSKGDYKAYAWICDEGNGLGTKLNESYLVGIYSPDGDEWLNDEKPSITAAIEWCDARLKETESGSLESATVNAIAERFAIELQAELSEKQFAEIKRRNATEQYSHGSCASHDFCDANVVMENAWNRIAHSDLGKVDPESETHQRIWNLAWDTARKRKLIED